MTCLITNIACIYTRVPGILNLLYFLVIQYAWVFMLISCMTNVFENNCYIIIIIKYISRHVHMC